MNKDDVKIAVFSSYDKLGGAARSCYDFVKLLRNNGYQAIEVVRYKSGDEPFVVEVRQNPRVQLILKVCQKILSILGCWPRILQVHREYCFFEDESKALVNPSFKEIEHSMPFRPNFVFVSHTFDLINSDYLLKMKEKWNARIYYLCSDIGAYTGGCHVHWDCDGFTHGCTNCPAVIDQEKRHIVSKTFVQKKHNVIAGNIGVCYSNDWMYQEICKSTLFKEQPKLQLSQFTDIKTFNTLNRGVAKQIFGIENNCFTITFGATYIDDKRKGISYFLDAINLLPQVVKKTENREINIVILGRNLVQIKEALGKNSNYSFSCIEYIEDMRLLSLALQASDVFVSTSLEDAGPMMVSNALACGTPVVGFRTGLVADNSIVIQHITGYACELFDTISIAKGIGYFYELSPEIYNNCMNNCREIAVTRLSEDVAISSLDTLVQSI